MTAKSSALFASMLALAAASALSHDPGAKSFTSEQIQKGANIYETRCAACHGNRMVNPPWAIDLGTFPRDQRARFADSVTYGVRNMPPWGDVLKPDDIEALWAYVVAGEKR